MTEDTRNRYAGQPVVVLKWNIGDRVKIAAADDAIGTVYAATISRDGIEYCVKWFVDGGQRCTDWFQAGELERPA